MGLKKPIIRGILEDLHRSSRGGGAEEHFCQQSQNQIPKESPNVQINPNEVVINIWNVFLNKMAFTNYKQSKRHVLEKSYFAKFQIAKNNNNKIKVFLKLKHYLTFLEIFSKLFWGPVLQNTCQTLFLISLWKKTFRLTLPLLTLLK